MNESAELRRRGRLLIGWIIAGGCAWVLMILGVIFADWLMWAGLASVAIATFGFLWVTISLNFTRRDP